MYATLENRLCGMILVCSTYYSELKVLTTFFRDFSHISALVCADCDVLFKLFKLVLKRFAQQTMLASVNQEEWLLKPFSSFPCMFGADGIG